MKSKKVKAVELLEKNVKKIVAENHSSLAQLAKEMGISAPSLTHLLKGNPQLDKVQRIADTLNVSIASLFNNKNAVEGYAIIKGKKKVAFTCIEELERVLLEAQQQDIFC